MFLTFLNRVVIICTTFNKTNLRIFSTQFVFYMTLRKISTVSVTSMNRLVRPVVADFSALYDGNFCIIFVNSNRSVNVHTT
jgi:hypothetical protein